MNEFHGCDHNVQLLPDGTTRTWTHLYVTIPNNFNRRVHGFDSAAGYRGDVRARVFERSISELKLEAVETVIEGNNLYRGAEFLKSLDKLAVSYDEELAKSPRKSFITNDTPSNTELELKFNIVKEIITDKLKEKADRETAKNKASPDGTIS